MTLDQLKDSYDWQEVFGDGTGGNTDKTTEAVGSCDATPPLLADVAEIIAIHEGTADEDDWVGVFRMSDERFCLATGGCDYTGWD